MLFMAVRKKRQVNKDCLKKGEGEQVVFVCVDGLAQKQDMGYLDISNIIHFTSALAINNKNIDMIQFEGCVHQ